MAEDGLLGKVLGAGEEEAGEADVAGGGADPVATAIAVDQARFDPELSRKAGVYLDRQAHLVEIQTEHLHEQRAVQLSHLKLRRFTDRLKAGTQLFIILVASVIGLGVLVVLHDAFTSRSVVVNAFKAPSALASRGVTGDVVAEGVLDTLQKLQTATRSPTKTLDARSAWSSDVKIEVPETGVSIGELDRLLRERFGHDLHIDGDLIQTETGGLALTVRGDGVAAKLFVGGSGDLDKLTSAAAEYVYGRSQPDKYADYLLKADQPKEALAFVSDALAAAKSDTQRSELLFWQAAAHAMLLEPAKADHEFELVMSLAPRTSARWWSAWFNRIANDGRFYGDEAAWRQGEAFMKTWEKTPQRNRPRLSAVTNAAEATYDLPLALAGALANASFNGGAGSWQQLAAPGVAAGYADMHDPLEAARYMAESDPARPETIASAASIQADAAFDRSDPASAIPPMEAFDKAWLATPSIQAEIPDGPCLLGRAYGLAGRTAEAEAAFKRVGIPRSRCYAFHGEALAHAGDVAGAQRVWSEGLRLMPDLPNVYLARGRWEMEHGDLKAATADLSMASAKAPHFADPLKAWGDLLMKEGRWNDALAKYDAALKYAPAWAELHQARDAAKRNG